MLCFVVRACVCQEIKSEFVFFFPPNPRELPDPLIIGMKKVTKRNQLEGNESDLRVTFLFKESKIEY